MNDKLRKEELELFVGLVMDKCGMRLTRNRLIRMKKVIDERIQELRLNEILEYYRCITTGENGNEELSRLLSSIVRWEPRFFAYPETLEKVADHVAELVLAAGSRNGKPLARVWFPYCGQGDDAYSFAMLMAERLDPNALRSVEILATGMSAEELEKACKAVYPVSAVSGVSEDRRRRFFKDVDGGLQVSKDIRSMISFGLLDLVNGIYPSLLNGTSGLNLIVLRGVLTFFNWKVTERIVSKIHECLAENGLLLIGKGERLPGTSGWEPVAENGGKLFRKKETEGEIGKKRRYESVKSLGRIVLKSDDSPNARVRRNLYSEKALDYLSTGETRRALITLNEAISSGSDDAGIYMRLADLYASRDDLELAMKQCEKSIEIDPAYADAHLLLGMIHLRKGKYKESMESFRKALFINPENQQVKLHIARALDGMGRRNAAMKVYSKIVEGVNDSPNQLIIDFAKKAMDRNSQN
ncbi:MAG: CheR family methyltransferase [Candidatus Glassbacteria bacterium]